MKVRNVKYAIILFLSFVLNAEAQRAPFQIALEPMEIPELGGIQSFAWAQHEGLWLIIGGRLDGLHQRQPFAAFTVSGNNNQILVIDPVERKKWSAPLSDLPIAIQEQFSSTNMEFHQDGDYLYLIGGYGYSATKGDHTTYPNLSAVKVSETIDAVIAGSPLSPNLRQVSDPRFAVTGGVLNKIYNTYHLTGGQEFIGRYNPMGPGHGPGFIQNYTNADRVFTIEDDGANLTITHLSDIEDATVLHRRDFNVVPQIMPSGEEGLTAFSGVFQKGFDVPFLDCVNIDSTGYELKSGFNQYYNHYHCAHISLYSGEDKEMHTVFFGGIAQYYDSSGVLVQDNNVPFVKTIARVTRDENGQMSEFKLPIEMPSLLGAGSEFIPVENLPEYNNGVLRLDDLANDTTHVGYIYGGISSSAANIFFINNGTQSVASNQIFKVHLIKGELTDVHELNVQSTGTLQMRAYPNPNDGDFRVEFNLVKSSDVLLKILNTEGQVVENAKLENLKVGRNYYSKSIANLINGGVYYLSIETNYEKASLKIIVE